VTHREHSQFHIRSYTQILKGPITVAVDSLRTEDQISR
jgi:hypothetical protein